jgi:hypothetical protein
MGVMSKPERYKFVYRGVTVYWSPRGSSMTGWTAEIPRDRAFEFLRAETAAELLKRIDGALARSQ